MLNISRNSFSVLSFLTHFSINEFPRMQSSLVMLFSLSISSWPIGSKLKYTPSFGFLSILVFLNSPWRPFWSRIFLVSQFGLYLGSLKHKLCTNTENIVACSFSHHAHALVFLSSNLKAFVWFCIHSAVFLSAHAT